MYGDLIGKLLLIRDMARRGAAEAGPTLDAAVDALTGFRDLVKRYGEGEFAPLGDPHEEQQVADLCAEIHSLAGQRPTSHSVTAANQPGAAALPPWARPIILELVGRLGEWVINRRRQAAGDARTVGAVPATDEVRNANEGNDEDQEPTTRRRRKSEEGQVE